ncbi:helix-turn-helix transcriptional regulator [Streptomyces sp. CAU 1734]|uniref:helix-turn-helix transcriptional regulator n=1 Tax=Streptomyces sp. CAU 1734 TaxID=3140360 RepID=UPI00326064DB
MIEKEEQAARRWIEELQKFLSSLSSLSSNLLLLQSVKGGTGRGNPLVGADGQATAVRSAVPRAHHTVEFMHTASSPLWETVETLLREERLPARGVTVRLIHASAAKQPPGVHTRLRELADIDVMVRAATVLPFGILVVDGLLAYVFPFAGQGGSSALEIRDPELVPILTELFEYSWVHWATAPTEEEPGFTGIDPDDLLDQRERSILRLLTQGVKDDAIARIFGVSTRTVRRLITEIMKKLDATSRFQAGARAMARGWLTGV